MNTNHLDMNNHYENLYNKNESEIDLPRVETSPKAPESEPGEGQKAQSKPDSLKDYGQILMPQMPQKPKNPRGNISYLTIIGHIEGHVTLPPNNKTTKYEHVIPLLLNVEENPEIEGLLIILNTVGGDVEAGLAIAELISDISKPTVSLVLGGGHSIGVPLAVASKHSFIAKSATMTIHPVRMNGTIVSSPQTFEYFNKMQERILDFVVRQSGITKRRLREIMMDTEKLALDVGTILVGEEAVHEKLINEVGGLNSAMEKLYDMINAARKKKEAKPAGKKTSKSAE